MVILAITWGTLAAAGFAGFGLGLGVVIGVFIVRWARADGGGRQKHRATRPPIDDKDPPE